MGNSSPEILTTRTWGTPCTRDVLWIYDTVNVNVPYMPQYAVYYACKELTVHAWGHSVPREGSMSVHTLLYIFPGACTRVSHNPAWTWCARFFTNTTLPLEIHYNTRYSIGLGLVITQKYKNRSIYLFSIRGYIYAWHTGITLHHLHTISSIYMYSYVHNKHETYARTLV